MLADSFYLLQAGWAISGYQDLDGRQASVEKAVARHNLTIPSVSQVWYYLT